MLAYGSQKFQKQAAKYQVDYYIPKQVFNTTKSQYVKMISALDALMGIYAKGLNYSQIEGETIAEKCFYLANQISEMIKIKSRQLLEEMNFETESCSSNLSSLFKMYVRWVSQRQVEVNKLISGIESNKMAQKNQEYQELIKAAGKGFIQSLITQFFGGPKQPRQKANSAQKLRKCISDLMLQNKSMEEEAKQMQTNLSRLQSELTQADLALENYRIKTSELQQIIKSKQTVYQNSINRSGYESFNTQKQQCNCDYYKQVNYDLEQNYKKLQEKNRSLLRKIAQTQQEKQTQNIKLLEVEEECKQVRDENQFLFGLFTKSESEQQKLIKSLSNQKVTQLFEKVYEFHCKNSSGLVQDHNLDVSDDKQVIQTKQQAILYMLNIKKYQPKKKNKQSTWHQVNKCNVMVKKSNINNKKIIKMIKYSLRQLKQHLPKLKQKQQQAQTPKADERCNRCIKQNQTVKDINQNPSDMINQIQRRIKSYENEQKAVKEGVFIYFNKKRELQADIQFLQQKIDSIKKQVLIYEQKADKLKKCCESFYRECKNIVFESKNDEQHQMRQNYKMQDLQVQSQKKREKKEE